MSCYLSKQSAESSSSSSSSSSSTYGTIGRGQAERPGIGGLGSMMDEMAKTLARRRAAAENKDVVQQVSIFTYDLVLYVRMFFFFFFSLFSSF
jgi:hypothetical protein